VILSTPDGPVRVRNAAAVAKERSCSPARRRPYADAVRANADRPRCAARVPVVSHGHAGPRPAARSERDPHVAGAVELAAGAATGARRGPSSRRNTDKARRAEPLAASASDAACPSSTRRPRLRRPSWTRPVAAPSVETLTFAGIVTRYSLQHRRACRVLIPRPRLPAVEQRAERTGGSPLRRSHHSVTLDALIYDWNRDGAAAKADYRAVRAGRRDAARRTPGPSVRNPPTEIKKAAAPAHGSARHRHGRHRAARRVGTGRARKIVALAKRTTKLKKLRPNMALRTHPPRRRRGDSRARGIRRRDRGVCVHR